MFIVVPYLSSDLTTYGIYSVCISVTVFLSYADLGFLGAGQKYAAESYARGEKQKEIELIGFSHFILLVMVLIISGIFFYLSFHPDKLISDLNTPLQVKIASQLLLILACFSPVIVLQRLVQMIFGIRLEEYNIQKINIIGSIVKISSVFYFFGSGRYDIVGYFLFTQIVSLGVALVGVWLARRKYHYDFAGLFRSFKFSKEIFVRTKSLAFSSLFATLSWVLYYELDSIAIGKLLGAQMVAIYAIGLSLLGFLRSLLGVFFSPFAARFNHFIGAGQVEELKHFYLHVVTITFPIVVFPLVAVAMMSRGMVISWVGVEYEQSVVVAQWLVLCNVFGFVSYPAGMLISAREKIKQIYVVAILMPFIFWGGIVATIGFLGVESFAVFKFVAFAISSLVYLGITLKFLDISLVRFLSKVIIPYLPALVVMCGILYFAGDICVDGKNKLYLLYNAVIVGGGVLIALCISLITARKFRLYLQSVVTKLKKGDIDKI